MNYGSSPRRGAFVDRPVSIQPSLVLIILLKIKLVLELIGTFLSITMTNTGRRATVKSLFNIK